MLGAVQYLARQNNRLSKSRLTRFNAVNPFILDEKCGVRSCIARMRRFYLTNRKSKSVLVGLSSSRLARGQGT
jgi:hypothetical protein